MGRREAAAQGALGQGRADRRGLGVGESWRRVEGHRGRLHRVLIQALLPVDTPRCAEPVSRRRLRKRRKEKQSGTRAMPLNPMRALTASPSEERLGAVCVRYERLVNWPVGGDFSSEDALGSIASRSRREARPTSRTAASKARVLRREGARYPLTFLTYCSAAAAISSSDAGPSGRRSVLMLRHMNLP